jgi:hypothetical protein
MATAPGVTTDRPAGPILGRITEVRVHGVSHRTAALLVAALVGAAASCASGDRASDAPAPEGVTDATTRPAETEPPGDPATLASPAPTAGAEEDAVTEAADRPPAAIAAADGQELPMRRGAQCWTDASGERTCADPFGVVTGAERLSLTRGEPVRIAGPLAEAPVRRIGGNVYALDGAPQQRGNVLVWEDTSIAQRLEDVRRPLVVLDVGPGRYALELKVSFAQGEVAYGVLLDVR